MSTQPPTAHAISKDAAEVADLRIPTEMFHRWHALPTELKLQVLHHRVVNPRPIKSYAYESHYRQVLKPLRLTSKELRDLAEEVYYKGNSFILHKLNGSQPGFLYPMSSANRFIQRLEVHLRVDTSRGTLAGMLESANDWRFLLIPRQRDILRYDNGRGFYHYTYPPKPSRPNWQDMFPSLVHLKVVLSVREGDEGCLHWVEHTERFLAALSSASVSIAPMNVEVVVRGDYRASTDRPLTMGLVPSGPYRCGELIKAALEKLFEGAKTRIVDAELKAERAAAQAEEILVQAAGVMGDRTRQWKWVYESGRPESAGTLDMARPIVSRLKQNGNKRRKLDGDWRWVYETGQPRPSARRGRPKL